MKGVRYTMKLEIESDPWFQLGCAIVKQAVDDWQYATMRMRNGTATREHGSMKRECESFFRSPLPEYYCDIEGTVILRRLKGCA